MNTQIIFDRAYAMRGNVDGRMLRDALLLLANRATDGATQKLENIEKAVQSHNLRRLASEMPGVGEFPGRESEVEELANALTL